MSGKTLEDALRSRTSRALIDGLRAKLAELKAFSAQKATAESLHKKAAAEILPELKEIDGENGPGVRFEYEGREYAAFVCQPEPEQVWNAAPLVQWLKDNGHWDSVSVTVLDPQKLEAELAAGNINRGKLARFIVKKPRTPYVKFGNPKPDSK